MAVTPLDSMKRDYVHPIYPCHLCKAQFFNSVERNDHLEAHFTRQQCPSCSQILILIDAELFVLSPHLPSQCLKDIAAQRANANSDDQTKSSDTKRRKSILSEPNILVDGPVDRLRIRNRKSKRIKAKKFVQAEFQESDDDDENEDEHSEDDENFRINVGGHEGAIRKSGKKPISAFIFEIIESDDSDAMDVKSEADSTEEEYSGDYSEQNGTIDKRSLCNTKNQEVGQVMQIQAQQTVPEQSAITDGIIISLDENHSHISNSNDDYSEREINAIVHEMVEENLTAESGIVQTIKDFISDNIIEIVQVAGDGSARNDGHSNQLMNHFVTEELPIEYMISDNKVVNLKVPITKPNDKVDNIKTKQARLKSPYYYERNKVFCDICNESMAKNHLVSHIRFMHHGIKTASECECDICGYECSSKSNLKQHRRRHCEENQKPFICNYCGKGFNGRFHLNEHINLHTGAKPYKCKICEKTFSRTTLLTSHMRTHTGECPFKCKIVGCDRAFRFNTDLRRHEYSAHDIWYKKHECHVCDKVYPERKLLTRHIRKHLIT